MIGVIHAGKSMLLNHPEKKLYSVEPWEKDAAKYFAPTKRPIAMPPPVKTFFVCERHKLLYAPIAKCGCSTLKRLMVELSELPGSEIILKHDVHIVTDEYSTGAQLKDYDLETVRKILGRKDYYKFSVVREPVSRAISAYTEKFLVNRLNPANLARTLDVLMAVRGESTPDPQKGISFREFAEYLLSSEPRRLDAHWAPQASFLDGVDEYNDIFTMEQFDALASRLSELTGRKIEIGKHNTSLRSKTPKEAVNSGRYADLLPIELDDISGIIATDFMAPDLIEKLHGYYREDLKIYKSSLGGSRTHKPRPVALEPAGLQTDEATVFFTAPEIARCVTLYSKGFFALNSEGHGVIKIVISNNSKHILNFKYLSSCALIYKVRSYSEGLKATAKTQIIELDHLKPFGFRTKMLQVNISAKDMKELNSLVISLRIGDSFYVEDMNPLHIASVQFAGGSQKK